MIKIKQIKIGNITLMNVLYKHKTLIFIFLAFVNLNLKAQDVSFNAAVSNNEMATGDRFKLEITANTSINNFSPPNLSDFRILSGPNQSTSMSWVNGSMSHSVSYSYILMATKEGEFTIGPATAVIDGKKYKTNNIKIKIKKGVKVQQNNNTINNGSGNNKRKTAKNSDKLFIKATVDKSSVYQGEQIVATYKLYTRVSIVGSELVKAADLNGFWSNEVDFGQTKWTTEVVNGYKWNVATIRKLVLFPQISGELEIDPLEMKLISQQRSNKRPQSIFDQFFGQIEEVEYLLKSKPIKINVKSHPSNAPESFNGAVGNLQMKANVNLNEVKANEAINLTVRISGSGNIPLIDNITTDFPVDFEAYDPKTNDNIITKHTGVNGYREFDYLLIPRHKGKYTINPISFSYFNPKTKKYNTITSEPFEITVLKGDESQNNVTYSSNKEDVKIIGEDIRYISTNLKNGLRKEKLKFYNSLMFYTLLLLPVLLFIVIIVFRNKIRAANKDVVGLKRKKANKVAKKFLESAQNHLKDNNHNAFYEAVSKALYGYTSDKLNIDVAKLNRDNIKQKLNEINVNEQTINDFISTIDLCDMARFAPVNTSPNEVYNNAEHIINKIEEEIAI